jgi:hypothetical protein
VRAPRHRFSEEVRSATRALAARMVKAGTVPETPAELRARIAETPGIQQSLESDGYGDQFTEDDLFPLFEAFVTKAGGSVPRAPAAAPAPPRIPRLVLIGSLLALLISALLLALLL